MEQTTTTNTVDEITAEVARNFRTFGGGTVVDSSNPIAHWEKDKPASFAMGVPVRDVVQFVLQSLALRDSELITLANEAAGRLTEGWVIDVMETDEMSVVIAEVFARRAALQELQS